MQVVSRDAKGERTDARQDTVIARTSRRRTLIIALATGVTAAIAYNGNIDGNLDTYHEGERLPHHDALEAGKLPFRDIFVQHGLGEDIIKPWLACKLYGPSVE